MIIYALRHGITEMNKKGILNGPIDEPLAPEGIKQAEKTIQFVPKSVRYVYSSPLTRAAHTAKILGEALSLPVAIEPGLSEIDLGALSGKSWAQMPSGKELKELHRTLKFDYQAHGGESLDQVIGRVKGAIATINQKHKDGEVLIVAHGGVIRVLRFLSSDSITHEPIDNAQIITLNSTKILA
ncbi:hypothetical protein A3F37_01580 [Candidatus Saccharibacteria bacterium RIFCSPHIGHO2_12_FULL_41_12]|nr:MAG: hypothetical protein A3F37_01580 [Candidatus Saccharibacteria bacterium RIFCSPHIGHO2_12_FULL_41_12]